MKKNVFIKIKGIQQIEDDQDVTELFTQGLLYKKNNNYYITYDESETTGYEGSTTTLKVEGNDKVTLMRSGNVKSHLIIENGTRNVGHYGTNEGSLMVGVYTKQMDSNLNENGGDIYFRYALDINSTLISENEVFINVKSD
ncbi:DUF1934 domain-containing protein [Paludicola sp. MB14-C6]|uniref:DUF1934 domain-containing protein n=1 Tax=Paludihabitans sp. MB14-C6 TaxID=3070656 RepID=UPI0027DD523B|nr:DUF1934 domain-containing protein [Paludicola sp. MB14-C6]WMJ22063.1 DUF1934 domain-containing protein [Paludicola sp. MB14-C6]